MKRGRRFSETDPMFLMYIEIRPKSTAIFHIVVRNITTLGEFGPSGFSGGYRGTSDPPVFKQGGSCPLQPLGRRSALHPGSFSLDAQRKGTKRNAPRRLPPNFLPEAGPTPAPQLPTGRIEQVRPRYRQKIRLITPSWGGRTNQRQTKKTTAN